MRSARDVPLDRCLPFICQRLVELVVVFLPGRERGLLRLHRDRTEALFRGPLRTIRPGAPAEGTQGDDQENRSHGNALMSRIGLASSGRPGKPPRSGTPAVWKQYRQSAYRRRMNGDGHEPTHEAPPAAPAQSADPNNRPFATGRKGGQAGPNMSIERTHPRLDETNGEVRASPGRVKRWAEDRINPCQAARNRIACTGGLPSGSPVGQDPAAGTDRGRPRWVRQIAGLLRLHSGVHADVGLPLSRSTVRHRPTAGLPALGRLLALLVAMMPAAAYAQGLTPEERRLADFVDGLREEPIGFLERVVKIDSATQNLEGVREVGEVFRAEFDRLGFETSWDEMPPEMRRAGHLVAEREGTVGKGLLLIGHLDTVLAGGHFLRRARRRRGRGPWT